MTSHSAPQAAFVASETAKKLTTAPATLALIGFDGPRDAGDGRSPWIGTGLEALAPPSVQAWRVKTPVEYDRLGNFTARTTPGFAMLAATRPAAENPEEAAAKLYRELLETARRIGRPHLLRVWQYLPRITESWHGEERYRAYCAGRARAFEEAGAGDAALPAACLLGDGGEHILLYALTADRPGRQIENPRQQSAFRYPRCYGRTPPSFSRATTFAGGGAETLFVSGTSSITGHASRHTETLDQLAETLHNLESLTKNWRRDAGGLAAIAPMKVYLRHACDFEAVRAVLTRRLPENHPILYLRANVCRPELNVEIEGIIQSSA